MRKVRNALFKIGKPRDKLRMIFAPTPLEAKIEVNKKEGEH